MFGSSTTGGNGVTGFVGEATGVIGSSVVATGVRGTTGSTGNAGVLGQTFGVYWLCLPARVCPAPARRDWRVRRQPVQRRRRRSHLVEGNGVLGIHDANDPDGVGVLGIGGFTTGVRVSLSVMGPDPGCTATPTAAGRAGVLGTSDLSAGVRGVGVSSDGSVVA